MADNPQAGHQNYQGMVQKFQDNAPEHRQVAKVVGGVAAGAALLLLAGVTLTGTVISLVVATPVLIFFSPILVPVGIVMFLTVAGFLTAGGFGIAALSALSWMVNYVRDRHPPGSDRVDYAREKIANRARDVKERAKEYGDYIQNRAREAQQHQTAGS